jgi:hypothetical protein
MTGLVNFITLAVATGLAAAAAVAVNWLLLRVAVQLMSPAAARTSVARPYLVQGTAQVARAFSGRR